MLTDQQLQELKKQLHVMKEEAEKEHHNHDGYVNEDEDQGNSVGELSNVNSHPGDLGTEKFEREKAYTLSEHAEEQLDEINAALERMEKGTYGYSEHSGKPIPFERLQAMPTARYLVEEQEESS
ncbi:hypothetical protein [Pontibacillus chungwhensis]|nr:hypothetical protein [Pontibacillus chungwhensis]